ncbi:hypothetical protein BHM03_00061973, partial [Ensete ventricosum]
RFLIPFHTGVLSFARYGMVRHTEQYARAYLSATSPDKVVQAFTKPQQPKSKSDGEEWLPPLPNPTPSFTVDRDLLDHSDHDPSATLSDDDCFLYEKYHSLYSCEDAGDDFTFKSPRYDEDPSPTVFCWTKRFFVSPATSNSLLRDARPSTVASSSSSSCSSSCTSDLEPNT